MKVKFTLVHFDSLSCEAIVRRAPNGDLLIVAQCGGAREPSIENRVYVFRSTDDGATWSVPQPILPESGRAVYQTETAVIDGRIDVFITTHNGKFLQCENFILRSYDSGATWQKAAPPARVPNGFAFYRGVSELGDGTLLLPYHRYSIDPADEAELVRDGKAVWNTANRQVDVGVLISRDRGLSYIRGGSFRVPFTDPDGRWNAPIVWPELTLARLSDGRVSMLFRIDTSRRLWRADSRDGGAGFGAFYAADIPNPANKPKLLNLPDGRIALLHTPNGAGNTLRFRNPLALWISGDDMESWEYRQNLTDFPGIFCYPDGFAEKDGKIRLAVENRHDIFYAEVLP
jgi:hypothetical protein